MCSRFFNLSPEPFFKIHQKTGNFSRIPDISPIFSPGWDLFRIWLPAPESPASQ
jgi:hypothetical protein